MEHPRYGAGSAIKGVVSTVAMVRLSGGGVNERAPPSTFGGRGRGKRLDRTVREFPHPVIVAPRGGGCQRALGYRLSCRRSLAAPARPRAGAVDGRAGAIFALGGSTPKRKPDPRMRAGLVTDVPSPAGAPPQHKPLIGLAFEPNAPRPKPGSAAQRAQNRIYPQRL